MQQKLRKSGRRSGRSIKAEKHPRRTTLSSFRGRHRVESILDDHRWVKTRDSVVEGFEASISSDVSMFAARISQPTLLIGADNDPAGRRAAEECAKRWSAHAEVRIVHAEAAGADLNDEVRSWVK